MKYLYILLPFVFLFNTNVINAQKNSDGDRRVKLSNNIEEYNVLEMEFLPVYDPIFEWNEFNDKKSKAGITKEGLVLENKQTAKPCCSSCELPINVMNDDFLFAMKIKAKDIDNKKPFGLVYDYENENNYMMFLITEKEIELCEWNGEKISHRKRPYKTKKGKDIILSIMQKKHTLSFGVNGVYFGTLKNKTLKNPGFGLVVLGENKIAATGVAYKKIQIKAKEESSED